MRVEKVLLAEPRGFCAGVEMAIKALDWMVRIFDPPVYCYHEIVHNRIVVEEFERRGVIFVDDVTSVPDGAALMLSAHGSAPEVEAAASRGGRVVVNACCPLVTKVHHEMKVRARKGYTILYVGHGGHEEAAGTMAVAPSAARLVEHESDLAAAAAEIPSDTPLALLAQTTLAHEEWAGIVDSARELFPDLWMPNRSDLCYATTNRQAAVRALAPRCDAVIVVGSANSSNTVALATVASGTCARVLRVNSPEQVPDDLAGVVGVTAGASAPDWLVEEIVKRLDPEQGSETIHVTDEDEYFPPPPELRDLLRVAAEALSLSFGVSADGTAPTSRDRTVSAAEILRPGACAP
ncbi:MAG: 4-hydroxy-3-methylbut-2-enyl diphosphate reductase [Actinomycetota bacterium]|jgi:4-hydroxy-3-methylbut-2-enyl diphosphate reductase|nr:4-hydroxy-3-methylbut-2-enyl diphosphate reductase [Actinomycetota bacterium]